MHKITIDITQVESFRIVCGECEKRAEILWHTANPIGMPFVIALACVRCHGETRLVDICQYHQRVAEFSDQNRIVLLWEQLPTVDAPALEDNLRSRRVEACRWIERPEIITNEAELANVLQYIDALDAQIDLVRRVTTSLEQPLASRPTTSSARPR